MRYDELNPRTKRLVDLAVARDQGAKSQRDRRDPPKKTKRVIRPLVHIDGPLLCRITRRVPHSKRLDDDNLSGGAKQLRDAIATSLGRKGDSEKDGLFWEYCQEKADKHETVIEIFRNTNQ